MFEEELKELRNQYEEYNTKINHMEQNCYIKKYNTYKKEKEMIYSKINRLKEHMQDNCKHNIWYYLYSSTDDYEGRTYLTCKCLDCDKIEESSLRYFKHIIRTKMKFIDVQKEYNKLKLVTKNESILMDLLKEKINK
ncbi:hypothetical protein ACFHWD_03165 [Clostridium sp. MT-14]|uniref:hypothetical protein n=1 Tax=Clostridium sp. MT-14 TaxID=3348360 RepID=UPI0035F2B52D